MNYLNDWNEGRFYYVKGVQGLYNEGEEYILKNTYWAYSYAIDRLKGRFKAGEEMIKENEAYWSKYVEFLKKKGIEI